MPYASVNGAEIYFERHGDDGEPLVLIHGHTGDITDWRFQLPEFSKTHRVLIMDNRGHGRSSAPADRTQYGVLQLADDVEAIVQRAGFERYHLLGHSLGGTVVQEIALRSPGRLLSLTLHDTGYGFGTARASMVQKYLEARNKFAEEKGMAALAAMPSPTPAPHMPTERKAETDARFAAMSVDGFVASGTALMSWPGTRDRAHAIAAPTLVIYGELDKPFVEPSKWLAATIPGAALAVVPEAGHSPQYERPDLFNAVLRAHLSRNASLSAK